MIPTFTGVYRFLSNFYIEPDGTHVEGEYQAQKCANSKDIELFKGLSPGEARSLGRRILIRKDWEEVKVATMRLLVHQKFVDHPELLNKLLSTGDIELVEDNWWSDTFWGKYNNIGENWLGRILMETRTRLRLNK